MIDAIDVYHVANPMHEAWSTAYGSDEAVHGVMVRMRSQGHEGWAESNPLELPTYSPEYAAGVFRTVVDVMAPLFLHREIADVEQIDRTLSVFKGNNFAKAAIEMAWWNLQSSIAEKPLYELLGGEDREVAVGEALGITQSLDDLLARIQRAFDSGYTRIKLKVRPDKDIEVLEEVRAAFPEGQFHIDGNCGYSLDEMPMFERLDKLKLAMIEQPLGYGDLVDHAKLQRAVETPICLDESCTSVASAHAAIELGSCKIINIKPPRVGGLSNSMKILKLCNDAGIACWVGSMLETSIATATNLAFASLPGITLPCDAFPSMRFYREEITAEDMVLSGPGKMRPLNRPSSAHRPMMSRLDKRTISHASLS
jgi:O-succinylbenzoate synthase